MASTTKQPSKSTTHKSSAKRAPRRHAKATGAAADKKPYADASRCWPGYEPVPGKRPHEQGSCRKKPASRNGGVAVNRERARKRAEARAPSAAAKGRIKQKSSSARVRAQGRRQASA